jgi:hypothetical protein
VLLPLVAAAALSSYGSSPSFGPDARCLEREVGVRLLLAEWAWRPPSMAVVPRKDPPDPELLLSSARELLGTPYSWGGLGEGGYDCSGFVNKVYSLWGYDLPRTSREQFKVGQSIERAQLTMGDLMFFVQEPGNSRISHVALYIADDEFIHAASGKGRVTYDRLSSRYYTQRFVGARRVLHLKPGRYAYPNGAALDGAGSAALPVDEPTVAVVTAEPPPPSAEGTQAPPPVVQVITEHAAEEQPAQLASGFRKGAVTHVGPMSLRAESTGVALRLGGGWLGDGQRELGAVVAVPEITYFGHDDALSVAIAAPFFVTFSGDERSTSEANAAAWDTAREWTRLIGEARYGQKESNLYVDLSRTASGTLGHGQLMRYYTPNMASPSVPGYVLAPDALSLSFDGVLGPVGGETFVDDVFDPSVIGVLLYARPMVLAGAEGDILRSLSLGLTYVVDHDAPYERDATGLTSRAAVHGLGLDAELKLFRNDWLDVKVFLDGSGLVHRDGVGLGSALGSLVRMNLGSSGRHVLRLRAEARASSATFIPTYFDTTYRLSRARAPVDSISATPLTKLGLLEELEGSAERYGFYGEVTYRLQGRVALGASYEDGGTLGSEPASERYVGRSLMVFAQASDVYLPGSNKALSFNLGYHLRNFERLTPIFVGDRSNEYLFVAASLRVMRHLLVGGSLSKAFDVDDGDARYRGMIDATVDYEL